MGATPAPTVLVEGRSRSLGEMSDNWRWCAQLATMWADRVVTAATHNVERRQTVGYE